MATPNGGAFCNVLASTQLTSSGTVGSCLASGRCILNNVQNNLFYSITDLRSGTVPNYSYPLFYIYALAPMSDNKSFSVLPNGTPINLGTYVGFQNVTTKGIVQTGPAIDGGAFAQFNDVLQLQTESWTDDDSQYRVFIIVGVDGQGQAGANSNVATSYGTPYFIQSYGKLLDNNNQQYWKVGDSLYDCSISTQDVGALPKGNDEFQFYLYDNNGGGAPVVTATFSLSVFQWILLGTDVLLFVIALILIIVAIVLAVKHSKTKKAAQEQLAAGEAASEAPAEDQPA